MPIAPTAAQSEASRLNGALTKGPATPEGRARSSRNGTRHGLRGGGPFALLPGEDAAEHAALLGAMVARHAPADAVERHWVEQLAAAAWRRRRLIALEAEVLDAGPPDDPALPDPRLAWLATLTRYAARIERDTRAAILRLEELRAARPAARKRCSQAAAAVRGAARTWAQGSSSSIRLAGCRLARRVRTSAR